MGGQQRLVARDDLADLVKVAGRLEHLVHVVVVLLVSLNVPDQLRLVRQQLLRLRRQSEFVYTRCHRNTSWTRLVYGPPGTSLTLPYLRDSFCIFCFVVRSSSTE